MATPNPEGHGRGFENLFVLHEPLVFDASDGRTPDAAASRGVLVNSSVGHPVMECDAAQPSDENQPPEKDKQSA